MNKLAGTITEIISEGQLSIVKVQVSHPGANDEWANMQMGKYAIVSAMVTGAPGTLPYLEVGKPVSVWFRENEVALATSFSGKISLQNRFECAIRSVERGKLLCKVNMSCNGYSIVSLVTAQASIQLDLKVGDNVTALVKTNEITLSAYD
jgi:molybdate transport system regulatory protein